MDTVHLKFETEILTQPGANVPGKLSQPNLMFTGTARANLSEADFRCCSPEWAPGLTRKH